MALDILPAIEKLKSYGLLRTNRVVGDYYQCYCPFHKDGNEQKPSFGILLRDQVRAGSIYRKGWSHCFTCQYQNDFKYFVRDIIKDKPLPKEIVDDIMSMVDDSIESEFEYLLPKDLMDSVNSKFALEYLKSQTESTPSYISEEELSSYRFVVDYMYNRGLTDELIDRYDIGFDANYVPASSNKKDPCVTFPVRDIQGRTLFICRRSIVGKRFYLPTGVQKSIYGIYELPKNSTIVLICESCFNTLTSVKYGVPSVALLGTGTPYQINQLMSLGVQEFVVGTDPDEAGDRSYRKLKSNLCKTAIVRRMNDIPQGKDINDLTYDEFWKLFNQRS